ncbi:DnaD domain protein [Abiotrophia sp. HMSC24B09]|uniref:DnaD domain protein n=1 Tax=Abiotrophia sp. HMSC24B09 TaxID=1581061 RepID=UPI0008A2D292|nr:DnaD domain protein [Abiotrophia sp. HMSC24B09]OFS30310.1 hypothetical protein HMPREF3093_00740 [Abiotrophia sp. HMSC24B09]
MSLKRVVDTRFWNQVDVMERYSSQDKLFALYLMTCPRSTQLGIYSLPKRVIAFDMSLDDAQVGQLLARFQDDYQVIAYSDQTQEVAILDFLTYSLVKGGQPVERLLRNQAEDVRDSQLLVKVFQHLASYYEHSHRLIDQLSQEVLATELKRRQELGSEGEGVTSLSQGTQLLSDSLETGVASSRLSTRDLHNQDPNQKDNQIHKENQSHNHKQNQNQNHNSASKLDPDSEVKSLASGSGESVAVFSQALATSSDTSVSSTKPATSSGTPVYSSALGASSSTSVYSSALGTSSSTPTSSQPHTTSSNTTSTQPFGQAINLPDQSFSQTLARAQSLTSQTGQSQADVSQQTMDQFVRVERDMAKLRPFYERYFGPMTGAESLQFRNWLDKIGYWPVIEAIEQAHRRQAKKPFAYISTICQQASKA